MSEKRSPTDDRKRGASVSDEGYEWTCPLCGESRVNLLTGEEEESNALEALRGHVRSSVDDVHGPSNAYPEGLDVEALDEYVEFNGR